MSSAVPVPGKTVVESFRSCEEQLADVLRVIPWCSEHESVWSPALTTVIMDACSLLDSLWGCSAWQSVYVRKVKRRNDLNITDYFKWFRGKVESRWVVFWGGEPVQIKPFEPWMGAVAYCPLSWWQAYTDLKHNRLANRERATLSNAVNAVAGLMLAVLKSEDCWYAVEAADWLSAGDGVSHNPKASLGEDSPSAKDGYVLAETDLFSYPVGWCIARKRKDDEWLGRASFRFKHWFSEFEQ